MDFPNIQPPHEEQPINLHDRAMDNLRFIRETMERATAYTVVSGSGQAAVGATALLAAWTASQQTDMAGWLFIWLAEFTLSLLISLGMMQRKSKQLKQPMISETGRRFLLSFAPPMLAGALLTAVCYQRGLTDLMPGLWLLLYGTAVVAGGTYSAKIVPVMGFCFMLLGVIALTGPADWNNILLATGFGGLHILFGIWIARKYGG